MKFWLKEREDYYRKPPVSEAEIEEAEKEMGHKLPETYRKLLLEQNGGSIRFNAYRLRKRPIEGNFFVEFGLPTGSRRNARYFRYSFYD